jgi:hypothetical protein
MARVQVRKCDEGSAFAAALQREADKGSGRCDDPAAMAGFLEGCAQTLLGPGVSARLLWDGAQHVGLTNLEIAALINDAPQIAMELMWVETDQPLPDGLADQVLSHIKAEHVKRKTR